VGAVKGAHILKCCDPQGRSLSAPAKLLSKDEARRIAAKGRRIVGGPQGQAGAAEKSQNVLGVTEAPSRFLAISIDCSGERLWKAVAHTDQADCKRLLTRGQMGNVIPVHDEDGPTKLDVIDALDAEIDTVWGLIAALQTIFTEHDGDPHIKGALRLANSHLDALATIRRDVDRL
jgi:hypothetical protein